MADGLNLLPCAHCGGEANYYCREEGFTAYLSVLCSACGAESGEVRYRSYDNGLDDEKRYIPPPERKADAAKLWNRRTPPAPSTAPSDELPTELATVAQFLMGDGELEGVRFGERHPTKAGAFWWRLNLRAAMHKVRGDRS